MPYRPLLLALFLLSGAASLIYQIYWTRLLTLTFGSTTFAVSAVLTSFMTGLALGAWFLGRIADRVRRPLLLYAWIEAGIAALALLLPRVLSGVSALYPALYAAASGQPWMLPAARLLLSFFILLLPCTLIGGTLPVLVRFAARSAERFGRDFGALYGMNTLGAVLGCVLAGFYLLGRFGLATTNLIAVTANLVLAISFWVLDVRVSRSPLSPVEAGQPSPPRFSWEEKIVVGVAVISGFTLLALEVLWTRALVHALLSTTYSFTAVLATLLLALALGSFLTTRWPAAPGKLADLWLVARLAWVELGFAVVLLAELPLLGQLVIINEFWVVLLGSDWGLLCKFLTAAVMIFIPATLAGMLFPLSTQILSRRLDRVGGSLGRIYLLNTLAAAAGALLAGFVMIPGLGVKNSYVGLAATHVAVGVTLALISSRRRAWLVALPVLLGAAFLGARALDRRDLFGDPRLEIPDLQMELLAYKEAADATFAVYRQQPGDHRYLYINGFVAASAERQSHYMPMMAHLPLLLHPMPRRVLVIAFGTGATAGAATLHPIERLDVVDISRGVFELAPYFAAANHNVLDDARARARVEDGRNFIQASRERYDVITSEPMPPKFATMVNFYTRDYYRAARARLTPDGVICQWVPFHLITADDARMIIRTFLEIFPHASLWVIRGTGLLIGSVEPAALDPAYLAARMSVPRVTADLARLEFKSVEDLLKTFALDTAALRTFSAGAPIITDNYPYLEFSSDQPYLLTRGNLPIYEEIRRLRTAPRSVETP